MPKISVIMPCLNMAEYIEESINSVLCQTLSDIEILIVDAGSTDGTLDIIKKFSIKDARIKVFHSDKKSYGYQVNLGVNAASGEYISIIDTDDYILSDMYESLYPVAVRTGADYVKATAEGFYDFLNGNVYRYPILQFSKELYGEDGMIEVSPREMPQLLLQDNYLWYGIYRNEFLKKIKLHESPGASFQDSGGLLQTQLNAERAVYICKTVYEYRQDNRGASRYSRKGFHYVADEYQWAAQFLEGRSEEWYVSFYCKLFSHTLACFHLMVGSGVFWEEAEDDMKEISRRLQVAIDQNIISRQHFDQQKWKELNVFLKSAKELYEILCEELHEKKKRLDRLFECLKNKEIIIFGSGKTGTFIQAYSWLAEQVKVIAFCDNQRKLQNTVVGRIPVFAPEVAVRVYPQAQYVIANKYHGKKMRQQLMSLGVKREHTHLYNEDIDMRLIFS